MPRIIEVESPYDGPDDQTIRRNILYTRIACRWALERGDYPYASHLFFTQPGILDDKVPAERTLGIEAGKALTRAAAELSVFFLDLGESRGMTYGREAAAEAGRPVEEVRLFDEDMSASTYDELLAAATSAGLLPDGYSRLGW